MGITRIPDTKSVIATGFGSTVMISHDNADSWEIIHHPGGLGMFDKCGEVKFINQNTAIMCTETKHTLMSHDGGYTWHKIHGFEYSGLVTKCDFATEEHGFVSSLNQGIYETLDGGQTWDSIPEMMNDWINDIDFASESFGMITSGSYRYYRTLDGGQNWDSLFFSDTTSIPYSNYLQPVNDSVMMYVFNDESRAILYRSDDFGTTWDCVLNVHGYIDGGGMSFLNDSIGVISANKYYQSKHYYTTDGGVSWQESSEDPNGELYWSKENDICVLDDSTVIAVGSDGWINISFDLGKSWNARYSSLLPSTVENSWCNGDEVRVLSLYSVMSSAYSVYSTSDQGSTWNTEFTAIGNDCKMDIIGHDTIFYITDENGLCVYRSFDGGENFDRILTEHSIYYSGVDFFDVNNGIVYGMGRILKTADAGATWEEVSIGSMQNVDFDDVEYVSASQIIAVGSGYIDIPDIWISNDGGSTWEGIEGFDSIYPQEAWFLDENIGFIGGTRKIIKTVDGGETWDSTYCSQNRYIGISDFYFPTQEIGYAVGLGGLKMLKTTDGGDNWYPIQIDVTSGLTAVHFFDENHGIVMGENGIVLRTDNGGTTFIEEHPATPQKPSAITLFPNPATNILNITFEAPQQSGELIIYNANGVEILRRNHHPNVAGIIMNVQGMPAGAYVVKYVVDGMVVESEKIVIAR